MSFKLNVYQFDIAAEVIEIPVVKQKEIYEYSPLILGSRKVSVVPYCTNFKIK